MNISIIVLILILMLVFNIVWKNELAKSLFFSICFMHKPQGEDKFCPMILKGVTYKEKADAGEMLLAVGKENSLANPVEIGSYRGFRMEVYYDTMNTHYYPKENALIGSDNLLCTFVLLIFGQYNRCKFKKYRRCEKCLMCSDLKPL